MLKKNYGCHEKKPVKKEDHAAALVVYLNITPMPLSQHGPYRERCSVACAAKNEHGSDLAHENRIEEWRMRNL